MSSGGLRKKLLFSHIGVAISSLITIMLLVYLVMFFSFGKYTDNQQRTEVDTIVEDLSVSYDDRTEQWPSETLMRISHQSMLRTYSLKIFDANNNLIWDTKTMGPMMMHSTEELIIQEVKNENTYTRDIEKNGMKIGKLEIQGVSNAFESQNQHFLQMFSRLLWVALFLVVIGVTLFSVFMAKTLSNPLVRIKQIATKMREGDLSSRVQVSNHHITEIEEVGLSLNHLAEALEQQDQLRKNLTADIAHELRTPLATIQSHIEAFQDGIWQATPEKLEVCHEQVVRLVELIQDLESLSTVENPMLKLNNDYISLNHLIQDSVTTVEGQFGEKNITLNIDQTRKVFVTGDYTRLVQVFTNLLNNSYKYTNNGRILIAITEDQENGWVKISDTGIGIGEDELPYIFERFYRGEKSRNRKTGGAGIGLAIVKAIVEAHGGNIQVKSKLNKGTEILIRLPKQK